MSGKFLARASALSLAVFLAACGGDDSSTPLVTTPGSIPQAPGDTVQDGGGDQGDVDGGTDGDGGIQTPAYTLSPISSSGLSGEFTLTLSGAAEASAPLEVTILDVDGNLAKASDNEVVFRSICFNADNASFTPQLVSGSEGVVRTVYTPSLDCLINEGKDSISARLNGSDEIISTIDVILETQDSSTTPSISLGYFVDDGNGGQTFNPKQIGRASNDIITVETGEQDSLQLWVSLVDADNNLITESGNQVTFRSACSASGQANFGEETVSISEGKVQTSYNPAPACLNGQSENEDIITARLNDGNDVVATTTVRLSKSATALRFSNDLPSIINVGEDLPVPVEIFNSTTDTILTDTGYTVSYSSVCTNSEWAAFAPETANGDEGRVSSVYSVTDSCRSNANGKDTLTARLIDSNNPDKPVATTSWDITIVNPTSSNNLAFGARYVTVDPTTSEENITFHPEEVAIANQIISAGNSTGISVSIVDPSNNFDLIKDSNNQVSFTSLCSASNAATFTPSTVSGSEGKVIATYTATEECANLIENLNAGRDEITATLTTSQGELKATGIVEVQSQDLAPQNQLDNLTASPALISVGDISNIAVDIVDQEGNLVKNSENEVQFSSICSNSGEGSFNQTAISGSEGRVLATYNATEACRVSNGGSDTITARLNGNDLTSVTIPVRLEPQSDSQKLAFGAFTSTQDDPFVSFREGRIALIDDTLLAGETTGISVSIVDPSNAFRVIKNEANRVSFKSICSESGFASISPSDVPGGNGKVIAAYTPTTECLNLLSNNRDVITATLTTDTVTLKAEASVNLLSSSTAPSLTLRPLTLSPQEVSAGEAVSVSTAILNSTGSIVKESGNSVSFSSVCSVAGEATFSQDTVQGSEGEVITRYTANEDCAALTESTGGFDTITARLNGDDSISVSEQVTVNTQASALKIGYTLDSGEFVKEIKIGTPTITVGADETASAPLKVFIVDADNNLVKNVENTVSFSSVCAGSGWASFGPAEPISAAFGEVAATYNPTLACVRDNSGEDTITATLNGNSAITATATFTLVEAVPPTINIGQVEVFANPVQVGTSRIASSNITAIVKNDNGVLMEGVDVDFAASGNGTLQILQGTTDTAGTASARLSSPTDLRNRTVTVTATAGEQQSTVDVDFIGTQLNITGPASVPQGSSPTFTATLTDSQGTAIAGEPLNVTSNLGSVVLLPGSSGSMETSNNGTLDFQLSGTSIGTATIAATVFDGESLIASEKTVEISGDSFAIDSPAEGEELVIGTEHDITLTWFEAGNPVAGSPQVRFNTTRGTLNPVNGVVTVDSSTGEATVKVIATSSGPATITATSVNPASQLSTQTTLEFVAITPDSITLNATRSQLGYNESSEIIAVVRDVNGNLVKNELVEFSILNDAGGALASPSVETNSLGEARTIYTSGQSPTESEGVTIEAVVASNRLIEQTINLTVTEAPLRLAIGTGNQIEEPTTTTYNKPYVAIVTDATGAPIEGATVELKVLPTGYWKGYYQKNPTEEVWEAFYTSTSICPAEDQNRNGILDPGEDNNGSDALEPTNSATVSSGEVTTNAGGQAEFSINYPQSHCSWVEVELEAFVKVDGSEKSEKAKITLSCSSEDLNDLNVPPPGGTTGLYGRNSSCAVADF